MTGGGRDPDPITRERDETESEKSFWNRPPRDSPGPRVREMGDAREYPLSTPNYNTPVKDLSYKDLLTSTLPKPVTTGTSKLGVSRLLTLSVLITTNSIDMKGSM